MIMKVGTKDLPLLPFPPPSMRLLDVDDGGGAVEAGCGLPARAVILFFHTFFKLVVTPALCKKESE